MFKKAILLTLATTAVFLISTNEASANCRVITAAAAGVTNESDYKCAPSWDRIAADDDLLQGQINSSDTDGSEKIPNTVTDAIERIQQLKEQYEKENKEPVLTRAIATEITLQAFEYIPANPTPVAVTEHQSFPDVPNAHQQARAIRVAYDAGIVEGFGNGTFGPEQSITRAEATKVVTKAVTADIGNDQPTFTDVESYAWYAQVIGQAQAQFLVQGYDAETFKPNQPITPDEFQLLIQRAAWYRYVREEE